VGQKQTSQGPSNWSVSCQKPTFRTQFRLVHGLLYSGLTALGSACFRTGEMFNPNGMTAAHRSLPFGTCLVVGNPRTGRTVALRVNDRGGLTLDLSSGAAQAIGMRSTESVTMRRC